MLKERTGRYTPIRMGPRIKDSGSAGSEMGMVYRHGRMELNMKVLLMNV